MAGGNDFFLNFGSNADPFSRQLAADLGKGVEQVNALTDAIVRYDETVGDLSSSNPLGGLFSSLDNVSAKLEDIGGDLASTFGKITDSLGVLTRDLQEALSTVSKASAASRTATRRRASSINDEDDDLADISYDEALRRAQRGPSKSRSRTATSQVTDDELSPARQRLNQSTVGKATKDANEARNAVKRVADINATLARNANDGADALKNLGQAIRTLTTQTKTSTKGVEEGRFQQNTIIVQGQPGAVGAATPVQLDPAAVNQILANAGVAEPAQAPARTPEQAEARQAAEDRRRSEVLTREQFSEPARPGAYQVPGEKDLRKVSSRINPGESFGEFFERTAENTRGLDQLRQDVRTASENRVGIQQSRDLERVQQLIGRRGLENLVGDPRLRQDSAELGRVPGAIFSENVRATTNAQLTPGQALTPEQYALVPQAVEEFQRQKEDFAKFARGDVTRRIGANPAETFSLAPERGADARNRVVGRVSDYREEVKQYDERNPENLGAPLRAKIDAGTEEFLANKNARIGAYRDFENRQEPGVDRDGVPREYIPREEGSTYRTPRPVLGDRGDLDRNDDTDHFADYDRMVEQAKAEARAQREAANVAQQYAPNVNPIAQSDAEELRARQAEAESAAQNLSTPETASARASRYTSGQRKYAQLIQAQAQASDSLGSGEGNAGALDKATANIDSFLAKTKLSQQKLDEILDLEDEALERLAGGDRTRPTAAGGGAQPPTPPKPPTPAASGGEEENPFLVQARAEAQAQARREAALAGPAEDKTTLGTPASVANARQRVAGTPFPITDNIQKFADSLQQGTTAIINAEREALPNLTGIARQNSIERAGTALRNDPAFESLGSLSAQRQTLGTLLQLPRGGATNNALAAVYGRGGSGSANVGAVEGEAAPAAAPTTTAPVKSGETAADIERQTAARERYNAVILRAAQQSEQLRNATLQEFAAEEKLNALLNAEKPNYAAIAEAQRALGAARSNVATATAKEDPSLSTKLFGTQGFGASQLRHIGLGLENTIGYTLVFEGLDQLKDLVHDGLEAQAAFARLQASLTANGIAAGNLRQDFANISAETATPLEQVTEAASELAGTLQTTSDIAFGAKVAAQLANISQGTLDAKDAAVALRDVVAAYGDQWAQTGISVHQGIQQTGDDIAHLSQLTGVNVKDIAEGTSQVASEARDFGLSQRTASTISAYVTQGTGQTGEQAASQTTRLISGLYNTKTQEALQRVLKPTGGASIQQQFATGDIGGVLTELIQQYGTLNDSSKQYIANLIGTGITARAFAALIGGGSNAVKALNGNYSDFGALNQQNQLYLQTISGRIKQLGEDFENFGSTLQQLGAFDFLGGLAQGLDDIFKIANKVFGFFSSQADKNYFGLPTAQALQLTTTLLEAAAAYKLFGSFAVGKFLGTGVGTRLLGGITPSNQAAIDAAVARGAVGDEVPAARYAFSDVTRQVGANRFGFRAGSAAAEDGAVEEQTTVRSAEEQAIVGTTTSVENFGRVLDQTATQIAGLGTAATETTVATETQAAASTTAAAVTEAGAAGQLLIPGSAALGAEGSQLALFGGAGAGAVTEEAATSAAATEGQLGLPLLFRSPTTGRFVSQAAAGERDLSVARQGALFGEEELGAAGLLATSRTLAPTAALGTLGEQEAERQAALRAAAIRASGSGSNGGLLGNLLYRGGSGLASTFGPASAEASAAQVARLGIIGRTVPGVASLVGGAGGFSGVAGGLLASRFLGAAGAIGVGLYGYNQLQAAQGDAKTRDAAEDALLNGSTNQSDYDASKNRTGVAGFRDFYTSGPLGNSTLGEIGNGAIHTVSGIVGLANPLNAYHAGDDLIHGHFGDALSDFGHSFGLGQSGPSDESSSKETSLSTREFNKLTSHIPNLGSAQAVSEYEEKLIKQVESQRDAIQKAGGNDKQSQAQIAFNINQLESNLREASKNRIAAIEGLNAIDQLNSQQVDDLQSALGSVSQLNVHTLTTQSTAVQALLTSGTVNPGSAAFKDLETAAGIPLGPTRPRANVVGIAGAGPNKGQYGYYDSKGQFFSSLNPVTQQAGPAPGQTAPTIYDPRLSYNPAQGTPAGTIGLNRQGQVGSYDNQGNFHQSRGYINPSEAEQLENAPTITPPHNAQTISNAARLQALSKGYEASIKSATAIVLSAGKPGGASDAAITKAQQQIGTGLTGYQQVQDEIYQDPIQAAQARVGFATSFGGSAGAAAGLGLPTGTDAAVSATNDEVKALQRYGSTLSKTSPQYFANLTAIAQAKQSIAQILAAPELARLGVEEASTSDAVQKASIQAQIANTQLQADIRGGASVQQIGQDRAGVAAAGIAKQQAAQGVVSAQYQLGIAQNRNDVTKAQIQLNQALQAEVVYRRGGLADQASLLQAEAQEAQARQAIHDALEQQKEGALDAASALANFHGDTVTADTLEVKKAQDAYAYAVQQYGKNSTQAEQAYTNLITARSTAYDAATDQITSGLDLAIAQLNASGQAGDAQRAANDAVQKAQVELNRYLKKGGKKGTSTYNQLYGAVITAQRTAFDTGLQAQLDTLDFQQQTYQITSAQEIASLQQILKNKQLTLAEQRSITLKIKSLQNNIREELTGGGLNIASDINLPTAYEVRRSIGAGFGGARTQAATVTNNNQRANVTIQQTLPNGAVAAAVANKVIEIINKQTGQQVRANSSTPRQVAVGSRRN